MVNVRLRLLRLVGLLLGWRHQKVSIGSLSGRSLRVLLIRPDHLGDVLLMTPALATLRRSFPQAHITLLIGPWARPVLIGNRDYDELIVCPFPGFTRRLKGAVWRPYLLAWQYAHLLRQCGGFDAALILRDDHWWGALLVALADIPLRIGADTPEGRPFLTHHIPLPPNMHRSTANLTLVAELRRIVQADGSPFNCASSVTIPPLAEQRQTFHPAAADTRIAAQLLADSGVPEGQSLIAIHPGAGEQIKTWQPRAWADVVIGLIERTSARIVMTGTADERPLALEIVSLLPPESRDRVIVLAGCTPWGVLAAILARCLLCIGIDSGALHLAAAMDTPSVVLFGPVNPRLYGPVGDSRRHVVMAAALPCQPCGHLDHCWLQSRETGQWKPVPPVPCMVALTPPAILEIATSMLTKQVCIETS